VRRRLFVGISLSGRLKKQITTEIKPLVLAYPDILWESFQKYHITVRFIGLTIIEPIKIIEVMQHKLAAQNAFDLQPGSLATVVNGRTFVSIEIIRTEELLRVYHKVNNCLEDLGFVREKHTFYPHVTIGKVTRSGIFTLPKHEMKLTSMPVTQIDLFQSNQVDGGRHYLLLDSCPLIKPRD
jgi:2'-5' RNA ligase